MELRAGAKQNPIIPDNGNGQDEGVDAIEDAAVAGEYGAGVFHADAALVSGLEKIADLASDIADGGHGKKMLKGSVDPGTERKGGEERADEAGDRAFPCFFGA